MTFGYFSLQSSPVQSQEMRTAIVDTCGHTVTAQLYLVQPLRPRRRLFDRLGKLRSDEGRQREPPRDGPDLTAREAECLATRNTARH